MFKFTTFGYKLLIYIDLGVFTDNLFTYTLQNITTGEKNIFSLEPSRVLLGGRVRYTWAKCRK